MTKITLKKPINHNGQSYEFVEIDEPSMGGLEAFDKAARDGGEISGMVAMLAADLGWPVEAVRKIRATDFKAISDAIAPFVEALKPAEANTGEQSAQTSRQS